MSARRITARTEIITPATSELPPCEPPPSIAEVVPHPDIIAGTLDNIPEDLLTESEQLTDELNHAGLDQQLPGEDRAPAELGG
jgi:hypothetical protein